MSARRRDSIPGPRGILVAGALALGAAGTGVSCKMPLKEFRNPVDPSFIHVRSLAIDIPRMSLAAGHSGSVGYSIIPAEAYDKQVDWSSSDTEVASVDAAGVVNALSAGSARITATARDGGIAANCDLTVVTDWVARAGIQVAETPSGYTKMVEGYSKRFTVAFEPSNATDRHLSWSSDDGAVAAVDGEGTVRALAAGGTTIRVEAKGNAMGDPWASDAFSLEVITPSAAKVTSVRLSLDSMELAFGESLRLAATVVPECALDTGVSWESTNSAIAAVDSSGLVTASSSTTGSATITVTTSDGSFKDSCRVTTTDFPFKRSLAGNLRAVAVSVNGDMVAACGVQGLAVSTDRGSTWAWRDSASGIKWSGVGMSASGGLIAALAVESDGVACVRTSTDYGASWTRRTEAGLRNFSDIAVSADGRTIAACVSGGQIACSSDGGATWTTRSPATAQQYWSSIDLSADGKVIVAAIGDSGYLWKSADGGESWTALTAAGSLSCSSIALSDDGSVIYAAAKRLDVQSWTVVWRSGDGGATWTDEGFMIYDEADNRICASGTGSVAFVPTSPFAYSAHFYLTGDGGRKWTSYNRGGLRVLDSAMSADGSLCVFAVGDYVFIRDSAGG